MIRLYKMELYKLFQNKIFRLGMLSAIVLLINIFLAGICLTNGIFTYKNKHLT